MSQKVKISDITIPPRRQRDAGDIEGLASSFDVVGQLQPIGLTPQKILLFGYRRIQAAKLRNWTEISANIFPNLISAESWLIAERDENTERKALSPSEAVEQATQLEST